MVAQQVTLLSRCWTAHRASSLVREPSSRLEQLLIDSINSKHLDYICVLLWKKNNIFLYQGMSKKSRTPPWAKGMADLINKMAKDINESRQMFQTMWN